MNLQSRSERDTYQIAGLLFGLAMRLPLHTFHSKVDSRPSEYWDLFNRMRKLQQVFAEYSDYKLRFHSGI